MGRGNVPNWRYDSVVVGHIRTTREKGNREYRHTNSSVPIPRHSNAWKIFSGRGFSCLLQGHHTLGAQWVGLLSRGSRHFTSPLQFEKSFWYWTAYWGKQTQATVTSISSQMSSDTYAPLSIARLDETNSFNRANLPFALSTPESRRNLLSPLTKRSAGCGVSVPNCSWLMTLPVLVERRLWAVWVCLRAAVVQNVSQETSSAPGAATPRSTPRSFTKATEFSITLGNPVLWRQSTTRRWKRTSRLLIGWASCSSQVECFAACLDEVHLP